MVFTNLLSSALALAALLPHATAQLDIQVRATPNPICATLASALPNKVFLPDTPSYTNSTKSYFFQNSRQNPFCVVAPTSAEDVSQAIKILTASNTTRFAVRSGGHSPNKNASNTDDGVTIDLSALNTIEPKNGKWDVAQLGPAAKSGNVFKVLDQYGRSALGARVASVGIGGFLSGGGLSFFSPKYGWGCDTVVNIQVVLASGEIVNANATSHAELFRALKGGQGNFGVATRFDVKTFPQEEYWGGAIQYPGEADEAQLEAFTAFKTQKEYDPEATIEQTFVFFGGAYFSSNGMFYTKPVVNASALRFFTDVQPQTSSTMRISNTSDFSAEIEALQPMDTYAIYATTTIVVTPTILKKVYKLWKEATNKLADIPFLTSVLTFQPTPPLPPSSNSNSFGFEANSHPEKDTIVALVSIYWPSADNSSIVESTVKDVTALIEKAAKEEKALNRFQYMNYATTAFQDPIKSYGTNQVRFLRRIAAKYDPGRVFQNQVPGGFKLA